MFEFHGIKSNFEFVLMVLFEFFPALSLQNTDSITQSVYTAKIMLFKCLPIHDKQHKVCI